jgi:glycosyltransferase involved in cell wall biosynthesis
MPKILYAIPNLQYTGAAKQVALLVEGLPRPEFELRVCAMGQGGPAAERIRSAAAPVDILGGTRLFNLAALWRLRRLVHEFRPDVIHTWGHRALQAVALAARRRPFQLLASTPFLPHPRMASPGHLDRWLLRRVDHFLAAGPSEADRHRRFGLPEDKIRLVPPGVEWNREPGPVILSPCHLVTLSSSPPASRFILCAGPLEPHKGFLDAIWAFDIVQYLYDDLHLVVAGAGSDEPRLKRFAELTGAARRLHFAGSLTDLAGLLNRAEVVWVPSRAEGGVNITLEAMAHGRPVVASRLPGLAELVTDAETGVLVTPGDKVEWARRTRWLLDRPDECRRLGGAARRRAATQFAAADLVRRCAELYRTNRTAA